MAKHTNATKAEPFEVLYGRLEASVTKLEEGGLSLDDAIALYEEGITLARECQNRLDEAEQKITKLRESYAAAPRASGAIVNDSADEIEYVDEQEPAVEDDDSP